MTANGKTLKNEEEIKKAIKNIVEVKRNVLIDIRQIGWVWDGKETRVGILKQDCIMETHDLLLKFKK